MPDNSLTLDISRAMAAATNPQHGITPQELEEIAERVAGEHEVLSRERAEAVHVFYDLYKDRATREHVREVAARCLDKGFENLVVLGIGGSALGTIALNTALNAPYHNLLTRRQRKGYPRLFVMENIDPVSFRAMLRLCRPQKTLFNVISKSGGTAETIAQCMVVVEALEKKLGAASLKDHLVVTTSPRAPEAPKSLLHPVAGKYDLQTFEIPVHLGGRFSVFSPVGMFPAAMLGLDLDAMAEGCAAMDARCSQPDLMENPAYLHAAVQFLMDTRKGKHISVMMPYADSLRDVAEWYRQLWAESLGKRFSLDGEEVFRGQTPVNALGATDQHSQVQLYREGPNDKLFNIIEVRRFDKTVRIPDTLQGIPELDYLRGKSLNKLMAAELRGTVDALKESIRPVVRISLPRVNAHTVAQLMYLLEVETAMAGRLYNVNTFDQPGVEAGKRIARRLMGGSG